MARETGRIEIAEKAKRHDTIITTSAGTGLVLVDWEYIPADWAADQDEMLKVVVPAENFVVVYQDREECRRALDARKQDGPVPEDILPVPPPPLRERLMNGGRKEEVLRVVLNAAYGQECKVLLSNDTMLMLYWPISVQWPLRVDFKHEGQLEIYLAPESFRYEKD